MSTTMAAMHAALEALDISALRSGAVRVAQEHTPNGLASGKSPRLIVRRPSSAPQTVTPTVTQEIPPMSTQNGTITAPAPASDLQAELARLKAENDALKARAKGKVRMQVAEKSKCLSIYGLQRFPVSLSKDQWLQVLDMGGEIRAFIAANNTELK